VRVRRTLPAKTRSSDSKRRGRLTIVNVVRSEAHKLVTLPAAWWLLGAAFATTVALATLGSANVRPADLIDNSASAADVAQVTTDHQSQAIAAGLGVAQILFALLGAITFTSEYSSGNIRPALIAAPKRAGLFGAKIAVVLGAVASVAFVSNVVAALVSTGLEQRLGFDAPLTAQIVIGTIVRATSACVLVAAVGCGIGSLLRGPISSISVLVGILILSHSALGPLQLASRGTPLVWFANLDEFFPLPILAAQTLAARTYWPQFLEGSVLQLDPNQSMLVLGTWAFVCLSISLVVFRKTGV
jgi:ABC-type transport system involved in multi-copper enzyme maturation permease subunit